MTIKGKSSKEHGHVQKVKEAGVGKYCEGNSIHIKTFVVFRSGEQEPDGYTPVVSDGPSQVLSTTSPQLYRCLEN